MADEDERKICHNCVGEEHLSSLIEKEGKIATCDYCRDDEEPCILLSELADHIEGAFDRHFDRSSTEPDMYEDMMLRDRESDFEWYRHGEPVLYAMQEAASIKERVAQDVLEILEERHSDIDNARMGVECEFDSDSHYERKGADDYEFASEWREIERSLKSQARFFNQGAEAFLKRLFANLDGRRTDDGLPVIVPAGPDTKHQSFYRARVIHGHDKFLEAMKRPDLHLGPPPGWAARAGRMNAHGISVFYGTTDKGVALAEVRPPVGSRVLVAEFKVTRPIRLLDVTALQSIFVTGSLFDPTYSEQLSLAKFMASLSYQITMPVMPDDEPTEYLITQMIADYLARRPIPGLDGILFRSVQSPGDWRNVVLFHHASRVELLEIPAGTEVSAYQSSAAEDEPESDYQVWEEIPPASDNKQGEPSNEFPIIPVPEYIRYDAEADTREAALRVVTEAVTAHRVTGVTFDTNELNVTRHRIEKQARSPLGGEIGKFDGDLF